jgi:ATP-dependent RNA helicase DDX21
MAQCYDLTSPNNFNNMSTPQENTSQNAYSNQEAGSFNNFQISEDSKKNLEKEGIQYLFPIQVSTFSPIYEQKDLIGKDRTGSGKTLAFCLPVLERLRQNGKYFRNAYGQKPYVLVVVPTRELAIQVKREMERFRNKQNEFRIMTMYGGTDVRAESDKLASGVEIIVGTPGRVMDHIKRGNLSFSHLQALILDETDQMLNIGFQQDIEFIIHSIEEEFKHFQRSREEMQMVLFSATVPKWVNEVAKKYMKKDMVFVDLVGKNSNKTSETVRHLAMHVPSPNHKLDCISDLVMVYGGSHCRSIIFTDTKRKCYIHQ